MECVTWWHVSSVGSSAQTGGYQLFLKGHAIRIRKLVLHKVNAANKERPLERQTNELAFSSIKLNKNAAYR